MEKRVLESSIQSDIIKHLKGGGFFVVRMRSVSPIGTPDLLVIKDGNHVFIEVKRKGGKVSPIQRYAHKQINLVGGVVIVVYSFKEFLNQINKYEI